ncbi:hypothetical protein PAMA_017985 [Pampus argenteus]
MLMDLCYAEPPSARVLHLIGGRDGAVGWFTRSCLQSQIQHDDTEFIVEQLMSTEKQTKAKVRNMESDGSCLLVAGGRGGGGIDGLISGSDYLLITIRREPLEEEENVSETTACLPLKNDERKEVDADTRVDTAERNGCIKGKGRKHHSHRRVRSPSFDEEVSPRPKGKKKKRKSERKRKRRRSPSRSLSPPRKKKKKKKKSSKKSKRHSSSSLKHKRKDERKHKKSSRTHSRRRRRYRRSESDSSSCQSSTEDRHHLQKSVVHQALGELADVRELDRTDMKWRPATKSVCKTAPKYRSILSTATILSSKPGSELLQGKGSHHLLSQTDAPHDYDSGNDTSSPPSSKTGVSRASVTVGKQDHCQRLASPEKLKFTDRDNASDSGNSVTSYASLCKPYREDGLSAALFSGNDKRALKRLYVFALQRSDEFGVSGRSCEISEDIRLFTEEEEEEKVFSKAAENALIQQEEQEQIVGELQILGTLLSKLVAVILQLVLTLAELFSRSEATRQRGQRELQRKLHEIQRRQVNVSAANDSSLRERKRTPSSRKTDVKHKVSGKRRRRKSYSPMKKRRRDSPSHLEARRITSIWLFTVPGSDPSHTSDPVLPPAADPPAFHPGAASSRVAAVAARSTASARAGAGAAATVTPPTGATVGVHPGTQSLGTAVAAGAVVH